MPNSAKRQNAILRNKIEKLEAELAAERACWKSTSTADRLKRNDPGLMHGLETLDAIMSSCRDTKCRTGLTLEQFRHLLPLFVEAIERSEKAPLFRNGRAGASDPGNRCKLERGHAFLLALLICKTAGTQGQLAAQFGVARSAACEYLEACAPALAEILPTPDNISKKIASCKTDGERKKFIPGRAGGDPTADATRVPRARPSGGEQKDFHAGKNRMHCTNTVAAVNCKGALAYGSVPLPGSRHDIVMVDGMAGAFPSMADPGTPGEKRIRLIGDAGFRGSEKRPPGIVPANPAKRTAKKGLTAAQKERNGRISRKRIKVENAFARMNVFGALRRAFKGTPEQFGLVSNVAAGLTNYARTFKEIATGTGPCGSMMVEIREERLKRPPRRRRGARRCYCGVPKLVCPLHAPDSPPLPTPTPTAAGILRANSTAGVSADSRSRDSWVRSLLYQSTSLVIGSRLPAAWKMSPARPPELPRLVVLSADSSTNVGSHRRTSPWNLSSLPFVCGCPAPHGICLMPMAASSVSNLDEPRFFPPDSPE